MFRNSALHAMPSGITLEHVAGIGLRHSFHDHLSIILHFGFHKIITPTIKSLI